ncbi:MAG: HD domain-containing protein [Desulfobulbaceae bacterium]|nr:HD domain-containing protein [Desulfobulbaceae bacterium]
MLALTGASKTDIDNLIIGGRLHDIGKIGVRDSVLFKPAKLTKEEFDHIKTHPDIGKTILHPIPSLREVLPNNINLISESTNNCEGQPLFAY